MLDDLALLIRLQKIDDQLTDIEIDKGDLPAQLKSIGGDLENAREKLLQINQESESVEVQKTQQQRKIVEAEERLKKSQSVLYNVKTTREYDAISSEMDQAKSQINECRQQLTELAKKEEKLKGTQQEWEDNIFDTESEFEDKNSEMDERLSRSQDEEINLTRQREEIVVELKKPILNHYDRIRKIRDGVGVAAVDGSACGYCFSIVPPQRVAEVKKMKDFILCEVCGCILVDDETLA